MKKYIGEFLKRGVFVMGFGPIVLAIVYGILWKTGVISSLDAGEDVRAILTISLMAFIAAGITMVYQIEELPLLYAILIHAVVLYLDYIMIYFVNGWLASGLKPFAVFTICFVLGYTLIWLFIYRMIRKDTAELNQTLSRQN